jgi:lipopolysaccharide export system protein LptC
MSSRTETPSAFLAERGISEHAAMRAAAKSRFAAGFYRFLSALIACGVIAAVAALSGFQWPGANWFSGKIEGEIVLKPELPNQAVSYKTEIKGTDKKQLPFTYSAERGFQDPENEQKIHLEIFSGTFRQESGSDLKITGATGIYDRKSKILNLQGNVAINQNGKFDAMMDKAEFNVENKSLTSQSPVTVKTSNGDIAADTLVSDNNGARMVFRGNVKAHFE